jgi:hypothetical protein
LAYGTEKIGQEHKGKRKNRTFGNQHKGKRYHGQRGNYKHGFGFGLTGFICLALALLLIQGCAALRAGKVPGN